MAAISDTLLVDLKLAIRAHERFAGQCARQRRTYETRVRDAIRGGDEKIVTMYAQQVIRQDNMRVVFSRMAVQTRIIYDQVMLARQQRQMTQSMVRVARIMSAMARQETPEKMIRACESLQSSNETLEVCQAVFDGALNNVTATTTPPDEVASLIARVSEEHNIDLGQRFANAPAGSVMAEARQRMRQPVATTTAVTTTPAMAAMPSLVSPHASSSSSAAPPSSPADADANFEDDIQRRLANLR